MATARAGWQRLAALVLLALASAACSDDDGAKPAAAPAPTVPLTIPTTAEQILSDPERPADEVPVPTTAATTTTLATGLPSGLGIPGAGNISLGGGSSISGSTTIREVPFLEVVAFVQTTLEGQGWTVEPALASGAGVLFTFTGPGAAGEATVLPQADGTVRVRVVLGGA
jgi:hypothetical protein